MSLLFQKLLSRKFVLAVLGVLAVVLRDWLGLSEQAAQQIVTLIAAYILGEGAVDALSAFRKPNKGEEPNKSEENGPPTPAITGAKLLGVLALCLCLPLLTAGCFRSAPAVQHAEVVKRAAIMQYASNQDALQGALTEAVRESQTAQIEAAQDRDAETVVHAAKDAVIAKADEQGKPPKDASFSTAEVLKMAADARQHFAAMQAARQAKAVELETQIRAFQAYVLKSRIDLANALRLQDLLDRYYETGADPAVFQEMQAWLSGLIQSAAPKLPGTATGK